VPLEENWISRLGSEDFRGLVNYQDEYQPGALRYDVGERSNFILLPMMAEALELVLEWTPDAIQDYCGALTRSLFDELRALDFTVGDADSHGAHLFGIRVPERLDLTRVHRMLQERQVHVSARGSAIRVSPHLYNDAADLDALLEVLRDGVRTTTSV
jgi:selenocysteine lyase/cysteine desulfurase